MPLVLSCPAAKIAVIVICAVSALVVVVLSAVYTKRAIDRRLASVHVEEEVHVDEQHYLLGAGSSQEDEESQRLGSAAVAGAPAGEGEASAHRAVMISVETPMLVRRSSSADPGSRAGQQQQQPLPMLGDGSNHQSWGARVVRKLGFGGGAGRKLKVSEDLECDAAVPLHLDSPGSSNDGGSGVGNSGNGSKSNCINRNGH